MNLCPRRAYWSSRSVKLKLQNFPQQLCKACWRLAEWVCSNETTRYLCVLVTLCLLCCVLFSWVLHKDSCFQWEVQHSLCEDYSRGLVAGALCYDLCVQKLNILSNCIHKAPKGLTLQWENLIVKAPPVDKGRQSMKGDHSVWEGMSYSDFWDTLESHFILKLGPSDHSSLIERVFGFADFNKDAQMSFGEIRSVWQLLQIPEFLTLFIFQDNSVFPAINSTCGPLYAYRRTHYPVLYSKTRDSIWDKIFPNRFRWHFPSFPKRVHIALGLLEYASLVMEADSMRFHMCDLDPQNFGYTEYYEMIVTNFDGIVSEVVLNRTLLDRSCEKDFDCVYGSLCKSSCDQRTGYCRGIGPNMKPDLVKICEMLLDYILYDSPGNIRFTISELISRCRKLGRSVYLQEEGNDISVEQNVILDNFNQVLWDQLKNEKNKWLYKTTPKPPLPV